MGRKDPKLGHDWEKGTNDATIDVISALFTKTQQRVLALIFGQPEREFMMSELINLAGAGTGAVQREVARLVSSGLVSVHRKVGRKVYKANERSVLFDELRSIILKTCGIAELLRQTLLPHAKEMSLILLFGSVAKGESGAESDIDLLIVSDSLLLEDVFRILGPIEERLGRTIHPTCYTRAEFDARMRAKNPFLTKILTTKHVVLLGDLDEHQGTRESR
jgi:predicted nucleotidyltransferase